MMKKKNYDKIFTSLLQLFPNPKSELNFETSFQLLMAVMMSAQTTDKQVNKITDNLFVEIKSPKDVVKITEQELADKISSINYYKMKAKHIYQTAQILDWLSQNINKNKLTKKEKECFDKYGYYIPETIEWLMKLPWVGEKTAKVILYVLYNHSLIAVDTHVHRVSNRLWIVKTEKPLETSSEIEKQVPIKRKKDAHHLLILFWRYYCTARNPKCNNCVLKGECNFYKSN